MQVPVSGSKSRAMPSVLPAAKDVACKRGLKTVGLQPATRARGSPVLFAAVAGARRMRPAELKDSAPVAKRGRESLDSRTRTRQREFRATALGCAWPGIPGTVQRKQYSWHDT